MMQPHQQRAYPGAYDAMPHGSASYHQKPAEYHQSVYQMSHHGGGYFTQGYPHVAIPMQPYGGTGYP